MKVYEVSDTRKHKHTLTSRFIAVLLISYFSLDKLAYLYYCRG